jgi:predicted Rossmann fold flavoprotein
MCAATAGFRGRRTLVIDHANKVGKKILMSGGGRCNFTNYYVDPDRYLSNNAHFCKSALSRYTQYDFLELVGRYSLRYHEKAQGQLFCDNRSSDILDILLSECSRAGVVIETRCAVKSARKGLRFELETSSGNFSCDSLVIASGGLSIPTMGATGFGFDIAKQFGLRCLPLQASLVPFTLSDPWLTLARQLAGVSIEVSITTNHTTFRDFLLFTHRGISGPAVLQASNYWNPGDEVTVDFFPDLSLEETIRDWQRQGKKSELRTLLAKNAGKPVARRFIDQWLELGIANNPVHHYTAREISQVASHFHHWTFKPSGTEGYRTAEVTRGGVDTDDISSKTFEAKKVAGLYFIGEVLDVTGWLGGYNFQWAWASGWCAGQYV